jgi:general secretion pathway protein L
MLEEAVGWWTARMGELIPAGVRAGQALLGNALIIAAGRVPAAPATLLHRRNRRETELGAFVPDATDPAALRRLLGGAVREPVVLLRPSPGALLERTISLPLAAQRELRRVIGYEMNRLTPFEAEDVFWGCRDVQPDRTHGRLQVRLLLVPKAGLRALLSALETAGLSPAALEVVTAGGIRQVLPIAPDAAHPGWQRRLTAGLAIGCMVLAVVAAGLPFVLQSLALKRVEDRIAALQPKVAEVQALRQRIEAGNAGRNAIGAETAKLGDALAVLASVTRLLPDDTYLNDLTLRQRDLTITGQSSSAAKLIPALSGDPTFHNPGFVAPVTRNEAAQRDVFSIRATVGP